MSFVIRTYVSSGLSYNACMSLLESVVLGLIQGLTEFIPVSSSGHLLLLHELFGTSEDTLALDVALHVGTLLALIVYFWKDILSLLKNLFSKNSEGQLARLLILATIPAGLAGILFSGYIDDNLRSPEIVAFTLALVALLMLYVDSKTEDKKDLEITSKQGIVVGFMQAAALVPGVSRSGITITTGMFMGLSRSRAARFSFLLAIPIVAGSALGVAIKYDSNVAVGNSELAIGVITAFISGLVAIKFLLGVISKVGLKPFAYYRLALAALVLIFIV